jgi:LPS-assembly lipoprotein
MSWYNRRTFLTLPLVLAACGFSPTLAPGSAAAGLQGRIRVADPTDKNGFDFLQHMEERLGRPSEPAYDLAFTITTRAVGVGINPQGEIQRYNLTGVIDWTLTRRADQVRVTGGRAESFTSYSATGTTVAELTAQQDAATRLMSILADQIVMQLQSTASVWTK